LKNDFLIAMTQVCAERHLPKEVVLDAIEQALVLAYKRNFGTGQNLEVKIDPNTGKAHVFTDKEVVEQVRDRRLQISVPEARLVDPTAKVGSTVRVEEQTTRDFGRIAAQTAKQVILQRIREAERETQYADWSDRVGEDVLGTIRNIDSAGNVILSLGGSEAIMPRSEQISSEHYAPNQRLRTYIYEVERSNRGPRIKVSRTHQKLLRRLLENEVPEIFQGTVEIKGIAREPGSRSKVAVAATQAGIDPVGSCVGMRGVRIQNIVNELNGEKIDVVAWSPEEPKLIANALSPAKVERVWLDPDTKTATVVVPDNQLSLAIGKEGQNARLAAKLTGWRIDIKSITEAADEIERRAKEAAEAAAQEAELAAKREAAAALLAEAERTLQEEEAAVAAEATAPVSPAATEAVSPETMAEAPAAPATEPEAAPASPVEVAAGAEAAVVAESQAPPAEAMPEAAPVTAEPEEVVAAPEGPAVPPEATPTVVADQPAVPPVELGPGGWQFEQEVDEEPEEEGERKQGKGRKKVRKQKGRAKRRVEWKDELENW
jgi:N utilization substance protein A